MSPWFSGEIRAYSFQWGGKHAAGGQGKRDASAGYSPLTVTFSSARSVDPEGGALMYSWDFGDGTSTTAAKSHPPYVTPSVRPLRRP